MYLLAHGYIVQPAVLKTLLVGTVPKGHAHSTFLVGTSLSVHTLVKWTCGDGGPSACFIIFLIIMLLNSMCSALYKGLVIYLNIFDKNIASTFENFRD